MSGVLVNEDGSQNLSNFGIETDTCYLNTDINGDNEKLCMSLDDTVSVCCNIIQQIIKITERMKFKSNLKFKNYFRYRYCFRLL
jgi:hypothetical protein